MPLGVVERRRMRIISAVTVALVLSAVAPAGSATATRVVVFSATSMIVTKSIAGSCWTTSIASRRRDAYRCTSGNEIYDPCFRAGSKSVACPSALTPSSGVRVLLTKPLPASQAGQSHNVWMMVLANGVKCNMGTGTIMPGYPFDCTGNWICAAPIVTNADSTVFVECGQPVTATKVGALRRYSVAVAYE
jgi:hypothetical protein